MMADIGGYPDPLDTNYHRNLRPFSTPTFDWTPEQVRAVKFQPLRVEFVWPKEWGDIAEVPGIKVQFFFYLGTKESEWSDYGNITAWSWGRTEYPQQLPGMNMPFSPVMMVPKQYQNLRLYFPKGTVPLATRAFSTNMLEIKDGDIIGVTKRGRLEWVGRVGTYRGAGFGVSDNTPRSRDISSGNPWYKPADNRAAFDKDGPNSALRYRAGRDFHLGNTSGVPRVSKPPTQDNWYTRRMSCKCRRCANYAGPWYRDDTVYPQCLTVQCAGGCYVGCKAGCGGGCGGSGGCGGGGMQNGDGEGGCVVCRSPATRYYRDEKWLRDNNVQSSSALPSWNEPPPYGKYSPSLAGNIPYYTLDDGSPGCPTPFQYKYY